MQVRIAERVPTGPPVLVSSEKAPVHASTSRLADAEKDMVHIRSDMTAGRASEHRVCS
jgi:hypothetical protein